MDPRILKKLVQKKTLDHLIRCMSINDLKEFIRYTFHIEDDIKHLKIEIQHENDTFMLFFKRKQAHEFIKLVHDPNERQGSREEIKSDDEDHDNIVNRPSNDNISETSQNTQKSAEELYAIPLEDHDNKHGIIPRMYPLKLPKITKKMTPEHRAYINALREAHNKIILKHKHTDFREKDLLTEIKTVVRKFLQTLAGDYDETHVYSISRCVFNMIQTFKQRKNVTSVANIYKKVFLLFCIAKHTERALRDLIHTTLTNKDPLWIEVFWKTMNEVVPLIYQNDEHLYDMASMLGLPTEFQIDYPKTVLLVDLLSYLRHYGFQIDFEIFTYSVIFVLSLPSSRALKSTSRYTTFLTTSKQVYEEEKETNNVEQWHKNETEIQQYVIKFYKLHDFNVERYNNVKKAMQTYKP